MKFKITQIFLFFLLLSILVFILLEQEKISQNKLPLIEVSPGHSPDLSQNTVPSPKPTPTPILGIGAVHRDISATIFWVGEEASSDNANISNESSAWDYDWENNFGGYDDPENRNGFKPSGFTPKENPFYVALPYFEFDNSRNLKESVKKIPWFTQNTEKGKSLLKNRWVAIGRGEKICFAQWEDVGPALTDDLDYVFGTGRPKISQTGIDLSPAVRTCLEVGDRSKVWWQFIDEKNVPGGPWKQIITRSNINWK